MIRTSQTGGKQYSDTSPFSIPWGAYSNEWRQKQVGLMIEKSKSNKRSSLLRQNYNSREFYNIWSRKDGRLRSFNVGNNKKETKIEKMKKILVDLKMTIPAAFFFVSAILVAAGDDVFEGGSLAVPTRKYHFVSYFKFKLKLWLKLQFKFEYWPHSMFQINLCWQYKINLLSCFIVKFKL